MSIEPSTPGKRDNRKVVLPLLVVLLGMFGLVAASVPLYRLFCQVTGYGGTTARVAAAPTDQTGAIQRMMTIRFNTDIAPDMPWRFKPVQRALKVRVGEETLAFFKAENKGSKTLTGTAVFNVTPQKAGLYFTKIECFCFTEQTLAPGESKEMPVSFFVDPEIMKDHDLDDVKTITLSYTFYPVRNDEAPRQTADAGATIAVH